MDRKNTASLAVLALVSGALAVSGALPATAAKQPPVPPPPPPPAEAGCYDMQSGIPSYQRLLGSIQQTERVAATPLTPALYEKAVIEESDRGVVSANMALGAVSCPEATYVFEVYRDQPNADGSFALLARTAMRGDGVRRLLPLDTVLRQYTGQSVRVQGSVLDAQGRTIDAVDFALTSGEALITAPEDALPPGIGGQQFWG